MKVEEARKWPAPSKDDPTEFLKEKCEMATIGGQI